MVLFVGPTLNFTVRVTEASVDMSFENDSGQLDMDIGGV